MAALKLSNCIQNKLVFESKLAFWFDKSKSFKDLHDIVKTIQSELRSENYVPMMEFILRNIDKFVMGNSTMIFDLTKQEALNVSNFLKTASPQAVTKMATKLVEQQTIPQEIAKQAIIDEIAKQQVQQQLTYPFIITGELETLSKAGIEFIETNVVYDVWDNTFNTDIVSMYNNLKRSYEIGSYVYYGDKNNLKLFKTQINGVVYYFPAYYGFEGLVQINYGLIIISSSNGYCVAKATPQKLFELEKYVGEVYKKNYSRYAKIGDEEIVSKQINQQVQQPTTQQRKKETATFEKQISFESEVSLNRNLLFVGDELFYNDGYNNQKWTIIELFDGGFTAKDDYETKSFWFDELQKGWTISGTTKKQHQIYDKIHYKYYDDNKIADNFTVIDEQIEELKFLPQHQDSVASLLQKVTRQINYYLDNFAPNLEQMEKWEAKEYAQIFLENLNQHGFYVDKINLNLDIFTKILSNYGLTISEFLDTYAKIEWNGRENYLLKAKEIVTGKKQPSSTTTKQPKAKSKESQIEILKSKKITLATMKSFAVANDSDLWYKETSDFNGMSDMVESIRDARFVKITSEFALNDYKLGLCRFNFYEDEFMFGFNCQSSALGNGYLCTSKNNPNFSQNVYEEYGKTYFGQKEVKQQPQKSDDEIIGDSLIDLDTFINDEIRTNYGGAGFGYEQFLYQYFSKINTKINDFNIDSLSSVVLEYLDYADKTTLIKYLAFKGYFGDIIKKQYTTNYASEYKIFQNATSSLT